MSKPTTSPTSQTAINSALASFEAKHFSRASVVEASYLSVRNENEYKRMSDIIVSDLLQPADQANREINNATTTAFLIDVVEGYRRKKDKPAAKAARDCLRKRLNSCLKEHGLAVSFKLRTSEKATRIEFNPVLTPTEEAAAKAERAEANKLESTISDQAAATEQAAKDQSKVVELPLDQRLKIMVELAKDLPADELDGYITTLQLVQIGRESQAAAAT